MGGWRGLPLVSLENNEKDAVGSRSWCFKHVSLGSNCSIQDASTHQRSKKPSFGLPFTGDLGCSNGVLLNPNPQITHLDHFQGHRILP